MGDLSALNSASTPHWKLGLLGICLIIGGLSSQAASDVELPHQGVEKAKIYVDPSEMVPDESGTRLKESLVALGIEDMNYHFERMVGVPLEVIETSDGSEIEGPAIVVGKLAASLGCIAPDSQWKEGFRLLVKDGRVLIHGETAQGTSYGIYTILERMGCDWVIPGPVGEIIPKRQTLTVAETDESIQPSFAMRRMWYNGPVAETGPEQIAEFDLWKRRQKLGRSPLMANDEIGHYSEILLSRHKEEFEKNPEMYALVKSQDGTVSRTKGTQIETTNPKVKDLIVKDIRETFERNKWPHDKIVTLPIGPGDGGGYSISPESQALKSGLQDVMLGGDDTTDLVVKLANEILERIGEEFPNLSLGYLVYSVHAEYPEKFPPDPRIVPVFAPISYSRLHSSVDPHSKSRAYFRSVVDRWVELSKIQGNRLHAYEYNYNLADALLPFSRLQMVGEDVPFYHKNGFVGLDIECNRAWAVNGPHDYVFAKMAWDASRNWKNLLTEFCQKAYGNAAPMLEQYYLRLVDIQSTSGQEAGSFFAAPLIFDKHYMALARSDFEEALAQDLTPAQRELVQVAALPLDSLEQYLAWHRAMTEFDFDRAKKAYDSMLESWQKQVDRNPRYATYYAPRYMKALMLASTEEGLKYSTSPYEVVYRIPELLPTAFDPTGRGARMNLYGEKINDSQWTKTHTYGSTWDAQGIFYRNAVWYRIRFELPKTEEGQAIGLFLGGFEDEANVWINGEFAGSSGIKFAEPAVFDLSPGIRKEGENVLAIQIVRNLNMWELGMGGIFRPSFVFVGETVETQEQEIPQYRVLPGGVREPLHN